MTQRGRNSNLVLSLVMFVRMNTVSKYGVSVVTKNVLRRYALKGAVLNGWRDRGFGDGVGYSLP